MPSRARDRSCSSGGYRQKTKKSPPALPGSSALLVSKILAVFVFRITKGNASPVRVQAYHRGREHHAWGCRWRTVCGSTRDRLIPFCLFADPEIARVGLNENEAVAAGRPYRVAKLPMRAVLRARTLGETRGFMKALVNQDGDEIIGFTAIGPQAGEILAVVQTAMIGKLPYTVLRDPVFTHPTIG